MNKKDLMSLIGILMLGLGFLSIILSLVGLKLNLLSFLYAFGNGFAFLMHILLVLGGIILLYISKLDTSE